MDGTRNSGQDVRASIWFLAESDLYASVKPYSLAFTPVAQIPRENIQRTEVSVSVSDLRGSEPSLSLHRNGFQVLEFENIHDEIDWDNNTDVQTVHYPRISSEVERILPGARCIALHHQVSSGHRR